MLKGLVCSVLHESHALLNLQACPVGISGGLETSGNHEGWVLKDGRAEGLLVPELRKCWSPCQGCQDWQIPVIKAKRRVCEALFHSEQLSSMQGSGTRHYLAAWVLMGVTIYPWFLSMLLSSTMALLIFMGPMPVWNHFSALLHATRMKSLGSHASC